MDAAAHSVDVAAARISFLGLFIEVDGGCVQIITLLHKLVHRFSTGKQVLQVLMNDILHILKLTLDSQKFVSFHRVLPLAKVYLELLELQWLIGGQLHVKNTGRLESVSEFHDQLVEKGICGSFVIFVVGHCSGCDTVKCHIAMALAYIIL